MRFRAKPSQSENDHDGSALSLQNVVFQTSGHPYPLCTLDLVRNHATARGLSHGHAAQYFPGCGVEGEEVTIKTGRKYKTARSNRDTGHHGIRPFAAPPYRACIGIDSSDPTFLALVLLSKSVCGTEKLFTGFENRSPGIQLQRAAPIDAVDEDEVRFRREGGAIPEHASRCSRTEERAFRRKGSGDVYDAGDRRLPRNVFAVEIDGVEVPILACRHCAMAATFCRH